MAASPSDSVVVHRGEITSIAGTQFSSGKTTGAAAGGGVVLALVAIGSVALFGALTGIFTPND